jgi:hypothetical protein
MPTMMKTTADTLERRLSQGADILFDMEQRGDTGADYRQWLDRWIEMLAEYEAIQDAEPLAA